MKIIKRASLAADELYSFLCRKTPLNMQECCVRIRQLTDLKWAKHHLKGAASYQRQSFREIYWAIIHLRFLLRICATFGILAPVSGLAHLLRKGWISRQPENIKVQGESTQPLRKIHTSVMKIPIAHEDETGFHCDSPFMAEYNRRVQRNRIIIIIISIATFVIGWLWHLI
jgi:hypothetical protein